MFVSPIHIRLSRKNGKYSSWKWYWQNDGSYGAINFGRWYRLDIGWRDKKNRKAHRRLNEIRARYD